MKQLNIIIGADEKLLSLCKTNSEKYQKILGRTTMQLVYDIYGDKAPYLAKDPVITTYNITGLVRDMDGDKYNKDDRLDMKKKLRMYESNDYLSTYELNTLITLNRIMMTYAIEAVEKYNKCELSVNVVVVHDDIISKLDVLAGFRNDRHISLIFTDMEEYHKKMVDKFNIAKGDMTFVVTDLSVEGDENHE